MIKPGRLIQGDTVRIVAPARKISKAPVDDAIAIITKWGLNVQVGKNLFSDSHSYLSGTDTERLSDLQAAIDDPVVKAIISARGGYGSSRIIDSLDLRPLEKQPKWVVGFSDITALHLKLFSKGLMSVHATMPVLFSNPESVGSVESLRRLLTEDHTSVVWEGSEFNKRGKTSGRLIGGNLSLIIDALGTLAEPDMTGCILVIEEIDEYAYRLDRMMNHLRRAGKLAQVSGLIVGHMTDIKESELPFNESVESIILNVVREYKYPVSFRFPSGHENPNLAWIHGEYYEMDVQPLKSHLTARSFSL
jgi:muramoyltetrapeptide carboxypeptidase